MKTIDQILEEAWYTKEFLLKQRKIGRTNGMWGKWGIKWTDKMRKMKAFESKKEQSLLDNLDLVSDIHDIEFENATGTNILKSIQNFLRANYELIIRILQLLHWTTISGRLWLSIILNLALNTIWAKYFKWRR